ncbi:hypothetical protein HDV00_006616 [Rhizophlyctis rosea]|nr:hypothetical protein HDV00_006616 [Rhizophlyctis rosea]
MWRRLWARVAEGRGGFAEYAVADVMAAIKKPSKLTFDQAATLPVALPTAILALFAEQGLGLKRAVYKVITTASTKNEQQALATIRTITNNSLSHAIDIVGQDSSKLAAKALEGTSNATTLILMGITTPDLQILAKKLIEEDVMPAFASGEFNINKVMHLEGGLEALEEGLRLSHEGKVSAVKLVVNP